MRYFELLGVIIELMRALMHHINKVW